MSDSPMEYTSKDRGRTLKPIFVLACTNCVQRCTQLYNVSILSAKSMADGSH
jgi:hypothetical protein